MIYTYVPCGLKGSNRLRTVYTLFTIGRERQMAALGFEEKYC